MLYQETFDHQAAIYAVTNATEESLAKVLAMLLLHDWDVKKAIDNLIFLKENK